MAVSGAAGHRATVAGGTAAGRGDAARRGTGGPGVAVFVRLKLRLLRNALRGQRWRVVAFAIGLVFGAAVAVLAFLGLAATAMITPDAALVVAALTGAAVVLGWLLVPLLFFGVDDTLDPARFALLPLRRRTLAVGMLAAAFVGVPPLATLVASLGLVFAAGARDGAAAAVTALVGVVLTLLLCIVGSRAVSSAFASMLRSRRVRDLAAIVLAVLASSFGPLQLLVTSTATGGDLGPVAHATRVLGWTPLSAGYVASFDVAAGRPLLAVLRLVVVVAAIGLLLWWWSVTMESAMVGTASSSGRNRPAEATGGAVLSLYPRPLRWAPRTRFGAIYAREARYWWRDPRRRAGLVSITVSGAVLPVAFQVAGAGRHGHHVPLAIAVTMTGIVGGLVLTNQFGFDGTAYSAQLLTGVPGRTELAGRAAALLTAMVPVLTVVTTVVAVVAGAAGQVPVLLGCIAAGLGCSTGLSSVISVYAAYPLPDTANPFAMNTGGGGARGLLAFVAMLGALALVAPLTAVAVLLPGTLSWLVLPVGVGYGVGAVALGAYIGGDAVDRRGPDLLVAVTPRR
ncbi:MAG TPA: ABC transporter permease [Micromonosporaceae bacterium]